MHFRIRKNIVQLIRTEYDPQTKKPKTTIIGRMPRTAPVITDELHNLLTSKEIAEAETWIEQNNRITLIREEYAALTLADALKQANRWFQRQGDSEAAHIAAENLIHELQALRKTLKAINPIS